MNFIKLHYTNGSAGLVNLDNVTDIVKSDSSNPESNSAIYYNFSVDNQEACSFFKETVGEIEDLIGRGLLI